MPDFDTAAKAQIDSGAFAPVDLIFIDFVGDPLRAATCGRDLTFASTGDPDLDGHTFVALDGQFVDVSDVSDSSAGSDTLTVRLSGVRSIDDALMAEIEDRTKWQGRTVRVWLQVFEETGVVAQGATISKYTGYASSIKIKPGPQDSTIELTVEKYLASSSEASLRNYLNQKDYDASDTSAQATLAAANMGRNSSASAVSGGGGAAAAAADGSSGQSMGNHAGLY